MRRLFSILMLLTMTLPAWSDDVRYLLRVDGMACPYCAYGIKKKIKALPGVKEESVEIRLNDGVAAFDANNDRPIDEAILRQLVNDAGFTLRSVKTQPLNQEKGHHDQ